MCVISQKEEVASEAHTAIHEKPLDSYYITLIFQNFTAPSGSLNDEPLFLFELFSLLYYLSWWGRGITCVPECMQPMYTGNQKRLFRSSGIEVTDGFELPCGCWN